MKNPSSYAHRATLTTNPTAKRLFMLMEEKKTNLAVAADVTKKKDLLRLADTLGPHICVFKTHIDIIDDFDDSLITELQSIAEKHQFLIFEDRKFADIGKTVQQQYQNGIYKISHWAHITNTHTVPGPGIIQGLREIGLPKGRGLLLLAEMSSVGSLTTEAYSKATLSMAEAHQDFVIGFITQKKISNIPAFIHMTPGVNLAKKGDNLGQQYNTPEEVIGVRECDIIIVGRGIVESTEPEKEALIYRNIGWNAYAKRIENNP